LFVGRPYEHARTHFSHIRAIPLGSAGEGETVNFLGHMSETCQAGLTLF